MSDGLVVMAVIVGALISLLALFYVIWPLLQPGRADMVVEDDRLTDLLSRKDATLWALKELAFDYEVGKVSEEDFQRTNQRLRRQAIALIQQIEKLSPQSSPLDEELEEEIRRLRRTADGRATETSAAPTPAATGAAQEVQPVARYCTNCGQPMGAGHKFCAHCGTAAESVPTSTSNPSLAT